MKTIKLVPDVWYRITKPSRNGRFLVGESVRFDSHTEWLAFEQFAGHEVECETHGAVVEVDIAWLFSEMRRLQDEIDRLRAEVNDRVDRNLGD